MIPYPPWLVYIFLSLAVFMINVIPAFMPPTWMVLSIFVVTYQLPVIDVVILGAIASSFGRYILAIYVAPISDRYLPRKQKRNIKYLRNFLRYERGFIPFIITFIYALGPLPSNTLFIVAGVAQLNLLEIVSGFFLGRLISYGIIVGIAKTFVTVEQLISPLSLFVDFVGLIAAFIILFADWEKIVKNMIEREKRRRAEEALREVFK